MAGHSKWANIKFRKMAQDARRGKLFTKYIREITISARQGGGGDPSLNPRLRTAIDKALSVNMTRDVIDRAIKRGIGSQEDADIEEIRYEGYGPGGVALMMDCMTNNRKRTVSEVRHLLMKYDGNLGTDGSVAYLFHHKGQIVLECGISIEDMMELAIEMGIEDLETDEEGETRLLMPVEDFYRIKQDFENKKIPIQTAEILWLPVTEVLLDNLEIAQQFLKLNTSLEELDDVQTVHSNVAFDKGILDKLDI